MSVAVEQRTHSAVATGTGRAQVRQSIRFSLTTIALIGIVGTGTYWGRVIGAASQRNRSGYALTSLSPLRSSFTENLGQDPNPNVPPEQVFGEVLERIQKEFVERTGSDSRLSFGSLSRMLASLDDPRTFYLEPGHRKARQNSLYGKYEGIGANVIAVKTSLPQGDARRLEIVSVLPGSPAELAGLKSRDILTAINGTAINSNAVSAESDRFNRDRTSEEPPSKESPSASSSAPLQKHPAVYSLTKVMSLLSSGQVGKIELTLHRPGQSVPLKLSLGVKSLEIQPVEFRVLQNRVGILRVRQFNAKATRMFQEALARANHLKGLVIDLRGNSGGVVTNDLPEIDGFASARKLLAALTKGGKIATLERHPNQKESVVIQGTSVFSNVPRIVLVDEGCANLTEMVAAALHDVAGVKLAGTRTFGDNALQLFTVFKNGAGIEMTSARLSTVGGTDLKKGLEPDYPISPNNLDKDAALKLALQKIGGAIGKG